MSKPTSLRLLTAAAAILALYSTEALACLPALPGSSPAKPGFDEGFRAGFEAALWKSAPTIVLAEIVSVETTDRFGRGTDAIGPDGIDYSNAPETTLKIVRWLRGGETTDRVTLQYGWLTSCGPMGPVSAVQGRIGERIVLFTNDPAWSNENVISIGSREALVRETREALEPTESRNDR